MTALGAQSRAGTQHPVVALMLQHARIDQLMVPFARALRLVERTDGTGLSLESH